MATERIPREFIQLLLSRIDLVELIDGRLPLRKKSSNNYFACCPFHTEKSASFSVSHPKQFFYCFGCGAHGNALDFLMQYDRLSFREAVETLAKQVGMDIPLEAATRQKAPANPNLYDLLADIAQFYQTELRKSPRAIDYLKLRGISGPLAKEFAIGFAPPGWDHVLQHFGKSTSLKKDLSDAGMLIRKDNEQGHYDRFRDRIMFPIHDRRGRIIGFGGRIIDQGDPKYLNSPETPIFQKGHELYGLYQALTNQRELQRVLIVEGYMDVIALFQQGITYAVATLGTATSAHHLQRLFRYTSEIIFCFDGDAAGRTAAWRALLVTLPIMHDDLQIRFLFLPEGEDPDTMVRKEGKTAFEERLQQAVSLSSFFFQSISSQADLSSVDGRARFVKLATEQLNHIPPGIFKQMMFDELAKKAGLDSKLKAADSQHTPQKIQKMRTPSLVRLAMTLLVQQPELATLLTDPLPSLDLPGYALFNELCVMIKHHQIKTTGTLLEHWRDRDDAPLLAKIAHYEHMTPPDGIKNEFLDCVKRLKKLGHEQLIGQLMVKSAQNVLSLDEKRQLQELINNKE